MKTRRIACAKILRVFLELYRSSYRPSSETSQLNGGTKLKTKIYTLIFIALSLSLMSCAPAAAPTPALRAIAPAAPPAPASGGNFAAKDATGQSTSTNAPNAASEERMIVRTVRLGLEVQDSDKALNDITAIASQFKGLVAQTNVSRDSKNRLRGTMVLRIPAESLDAALKQIKATSLKVLTENSNANDVTDQYTDLSARQKNLEAAEVELTKLLATVREKTGKAEDILAVYNQLTQIRGQIEQIKGQINVINRTTALATVTIDLTPHDDVQILEPETWLPNRTAALALRSLIQALQGLADLAIWLILFVLPVLIVLALPFVLFVWILRMFIRRRAKAKAPTTA